MYEGHFGLKKRPFASVPAVEQYFPAETLETARRTVARCIQRAEGTAMLVGPAGVGKTLLCQLLAEQFGHELATVLVAAGSVSTRRTLFQAMLYELGRPYRGMDEGELRLALVDYLTVSSERPAGMLLLVDDAHTLPVRLFEELRLLGGLVADGQPRVRLVLAGSPLLEEQLASPRLESFSQQMVARCYLETLNRTETERYIQAQMVNAGGRSGATFLPEACQAVHKATDGVPRLVNQVCDHALLLACAGGKRQLAAAGIEEAWADLQQLPAPWQEAASGPANVIEFGQLHDESDGEAPQRLEAMVPPGTAALRVAPGSQKPCDEPVARLAATDEKLADLEDDFQPAGSIEPEVELVFDGSQDPFGESFAEETLVVDRYRMVEPAAPRTTLRLEPIPAATLPVRRLAESKPAPPATIEYGTLDDDPYQPAASAPGAAASATPAVKPTATVAQALGQSIDPEAEETWSRPTETVRLRRSELPETALGSDNDEDLILVEEGYERVEPLHGRQVAVVRQKEYGQLFARLRRSS